MEIEESSVESGCHLVEKFGTAHNKIFPKAHLLRHQPKIWPRTCPDISTDFLEVLGLKMVCKYI